MEKVHSWRRLKAVFMTIKKYKTQTLGTCQDDEYKRCGVMIDNWCSNSTFCTVTDVGLMLLYVMCVLIVWTIWDDISISFYIVFADIHSMV